MLLGKLSNNMSELVHIKSKIKINNGLITKLNIK